MVVERVKTGIASYRDYPNSLDELMGGGIPKGNIVLVTGPTGSGKSTLAMQYLLAGAELGERGIYVSFEQRREDILRMDDVFSWKLKDMVKADMIRLISHSVTDNIPSSVLKGIKSIIDDFHPSRLVYDSISTFLVYMEIIGYVELVMDYSLEDKNYITVSPEMAQRRTIMRLIETLKAGNITSFIISERPEIGNYLSRDTISEFLVDGIISLNFIGIGGDQFGDLQIRKMRNTKHARNHFMTHMTESGLSIGEETMDMLR